MGPRRERLAAARNGAAPREFFYGYFDLCARGFDVALVDTQSDPQGVFANLLLKWEIVRNRIMGRGFSVQRVAAVASALADTDVAISVTDSFSISLGLHADKLKDRPFLIGGFMGLADLPTAVPGFARSYFEHRIRQAVANLDHIYFLGAADRDASCTRFGIVRERTSLLTFGVDTDFWSPGASPADGADYVLAVGSDLNRDYTTLLEAEFDMPLRIVTRLPVQVPPGRDVEILRGNLKSSAITDKHLRELYRSAAAVVVPLHDVYQPSGQSVTLQAMACGAPVVLTRTKGIWDPTALRHGENCMLVDPHTPGQIADALDILASDLGLRNRLASSARETAETRFSMAHMEAGIRALIDYAELPARP